MSASGRKRLRKQSKTALAIELVAVILIVAAVVGAVLFYMSQKSVLAPAKTGTPVVSSSVPTTTLPNTPAQTDQILPLKEDKLYPDKSALPESEEVDSKRLPGYAARLAIIIDDMGSSMSEALSLAAINVPLTFSIIPGLRLDTDVAEYAASQKIDTMIHIPMQSKGWPTRQLEANGLLVSMDTDELQKRVSGFIQRLPGAVGVNNHMGSEFTEQEDKMLSILEVLKEKNLFFIDSATSPESSGLKVAQRLGVRSARRNVFLDNEQERGYILGQLNQVIRLARKKGSAIAICHPHPTTIATLASVLPTLAGQGVQLVPASRLVK